MINRKVDVLLKDNTAKLKEKIFLYKDDYGVNLRFNIVKELDYYIKKENIIETNSLEGSKVIVLFVNPSGEGFYTSEGFIEEGYVSFTVTHEMTDEFRDCGEYKLQIRLIGDDYRLTIPSFTFTVSELISDTNINNNNPPVVGRAIVGNSALMASSSATLFTIEDGYIKTTWENGDIITKERLNNIEDGIANLYEKIDETSSEGAADWITNTALGNIPENFNTTGMSALELLKMAMVAYVNPTATVSWSQSNTLLKVGQTFNLTITVSSINKGTSDINKLELYKGSDLLQTIPYEAGTASYSFDLIEDVGANTTFKVNVVDVEGKSTSYTKSYSFVYPYYWGSSNDIPTADTISSSTEMVESKGDKTLTHIAANQYVFIAYPKTYGDLNSILDSNGFENIYGFTKIEVSVNGVNYYCYYIGKITVAGFKLTYKH